MIDLTQIEAVLCGTDRDARRRALDALLQWIRADRANGVAALPVFRRMLEAACDVWAATSAIKGIGEVAGPEEGRRTLLAFLLQAPRHIAAAVALSIRDLADVPVLIEALSRRPETDMRIPVVRALGRLHDPAVYPALLPHLDQPELRPHVVEALGELKDDRAVPVLESLLADRTDAWHIDNHGPMLRVCDLAQSALQSIRAARPAQPAPSAPPKPPTGSSSSAAAPKRGTTLLSIGGILIGIVMTGVGVPLVIWGGIAVLFIVVAIGKGDLSGIGVLIVMTLITLAGLGLVVFGVIGVARPLIHYVRSLAS